MNIHLQLWTLFLALAPCSYGEKTKALTFKQEVGGKEHSYILTNSFFMHAGPGCRGFALESVEHDKPNELKFKITNLWAIIATFEGDERPEKIKAMVGKTYLLKHKDGKILSIKEVEQQEP